MIHIDDGRRGSYHLIDPHVYDGRAVEVAIHYAQIALEVVVGQIRRVVGPGIDARRALAEMEIAATEVHEQRVRIDVAGPLIAALDVAVADVGTAIYLARAIPPQDAVGHRRRVAVVVHPAAVRSS